VVDTFSLLRGGHQLKLAVDWRDMATRNNTRAYDLMVYFVTANGAGSDMPSQIVQGAQADITIHFRNFRRSRRTRGRYRGT